MDQKDIVQQHGYGHWGPAINAHHRFLGHTNSVFDIQRDSETNKLAAT